MAKSVCLWALVDVPANACVTRPIRMVGTGMHDEVKPTDVFIGTVQLHGGNLVLHVFEVTK